MCGILGSVNVALDSADLERLAHRGPDGKGEVAIPVGSHQVYLGHRRLAIVDLSPTGSQPMRSADNRHWLTYNGEIYNHEDFRRRLGMHAFRGRSDTETLVELLATRGVHALPEVNGIFAFAWLDTIAKKLYLVRDPFGVKPLYYFSTDSSVAFASELRALLRVMPREVDRGNLATLLRLRFSPSPDTLFRGVKKLRPGCILEISLGEARLVAREYSYAPSVQGATGDAGDYQSAVVEYGRLFEQAVDRQLMSDVEVGVLLSGGVDSALVAAAAQRRAAQPLKAFTIGFTGAGSSDVDEVDDARETAAHLGMEHRSFRMAYPEFLSTLRECVRIVEEPLATTSIVPMYYLSRLASQDVKVVLSGQGADEVLGGYTRYQGELYRDVIPVWAARLAGKAGGQLGVRSDQVTRGLRALGERDELSRFIASYEVFSAGDVSEMLGLEVRDQARERVSEAYEMIGCSSLRTGVERMMSLDLRFGLSDDLLLYTDKMTMHDSMECRVPLLDHDLVRYVEALPPQFRVTRRERKRIHKDYAVRSLTAEIIGRRKKGFLSPTREWFRDGSALREILLNRESKFAAYFELRPVEAVIRQHADGFNRERHIFLLLSLYFFLDQFG